MCEKSFDKMAAAAAAVEDLTMQVPVASLYFDAFEDKNWNSC